ncbi:MAG: ATP-dependent helicase [Phycisphaerales bacterium]|nr:ATP-dependent helicase [Phycisphaerales bacterium]
MNPAAAKPFPLTDRQREAVDHDTGPLIILAGPGTGKTRVITERVAAMVTERNLNPEQILAVTFTNKAAGELADRLNGSLGPAVAQRISTSTFHSFGLRVISRFGDALGLPANPILIDSSQRRQLTRELINAQGLYKSIRGAGIDSAIEHAHTTIANLRNAGIDAKHARRWCEHELDELLDASDQESTARREVMSRFGEAVRLFALFDRACIDRGWMVFDDLIAWPTRLMRTKPNIAAILRQEHQHLVVDEFQDVNAAQIALLEALCPPTSNPDLCVVGDDDQSIYAFRGADDRAFARFDSIWPSTRTITLDDNFRSEPIIVQGANTIITNAPDGSRFAPEKIANAFKPDSSTSSIELVRLEHEEQAGDAIVAMLLKMRAQSPELDFSKVAVIARASLDLSRIARVLEIAGIPFDVRERTALMDDTGVQDILAWSRVIIDPTSTSDLRRVLSRPPMRADPHELGSLLASWKKAHALAAVDPTEHAAPGAILPWMKSRATSEMSTIVERAIGLCADLALVNAESPAAATLMEIIKRTGVIHSDLPDARARTSRINAIIGLLGFARSRASRLDQPGDLASLHRYIDDLDPADKSLGQLPEDTVNDHQEPDDAASSGAIQLLTAHASKGLEFDTVFIPRVSSPHGFPKMAGADNERLPDGLIDRVGDERDDKQRRADEERRVFYVALTRAERRVVLLAKLPKSSRSTNFALELLADPAANVVEHEVRTLLDNEHSADAIAKLASDFKVRKQIRDTFDTLRRTARIRAAVALDHADTLGVDPSELEETLLTSARTIAIASFIESNGHAPDWAADCSMSELSEQLVESLAESAPMEPTMPPGIAGPLNLSYTRIQTYLNCPRCYLVKYVYELPDEEHAASTTGSAVHRALELFYTQWRDADAEGIPTPGVDQLQALTKAAFLQLWPAHIELDTARLEQAIAQAHTVWEKLHDQQAQILELERDVKVPYECEGVTHTLIAKIDRIDQLATGGHRVIDYKTGYPKQDLLEPKKTDLQMGIYAMALQTLFGEDISGSDFEYWLLQDGSQGRIGADDLNTASIEKTINKVITGISTGQWAKGSKCRGDCDILDLNPNLG